MIKPDLTFKPETREHTINGDYCYTLLNDGTISVCDAQDVGLLPKKKFHKDHGYARTSDEKRSIHQFLNPDWKMTDHIDGNKLNNCRYNLRQCNNSQNGANRKKASGTTSIYKGVSWNKRDGKWEVCIEARKIRYHMGKYENEMIAAKAYDKRAIELFGEFAKTNFIELGLPMKEVLSLCH